MAEITDKFKKYEKNLLWETPIEIYGLHIYPVIMRNVYEFYDSISTLQVNPMDLNFGEYTNQLQSLSCLDLMVLFSNNDKKFHDRFHTILRLAFRVSDESIRETVKDEKIVLTIIQNGREITLSSGKFNKVKDIILYQNSIDLVDLRTNQRILEANKRVDEMNRAGSDMTIEDQIYSVCAVGQMDVKDIEKWSIRRFKRMTESYDNYINYKIFKSAEMSGFVKFKGDNPFKSWMSRTKDSTKELKTVNEIAKTFGLQVKN